MLKNKNNVNEQKLVDLLVKSYKIFMYNILNLLQRHMEGEHCDYE